MRYSHPQEMFAEIEFALSKMTDQLSLINRFARCPRCGGAAAFTLLETTQLECGHCQAGFSFEEEMLDFVAGQQRTKLDDIDYDAFYSVDDQLFDQFRFLKERTLPLFEQRFESILEIGAGTGGLTVGMLAGSDIGTAVVTDISPGMLAQCRKRLRHFDIATPTLFATNNGENLNVQDDSFDLIVAYFCVHHIFDYEKFLGSCHSALRPGGTAIFVEPGLRFMHALCSGTLPAIARMAGEPKYWENPDFNAVLGVHRNMSFTTKYAGVASVVAELEDKHAFGRYEFESSARGAGFSDVEAIPYGVADDPLSALRVYGAQLGASAEFLHEFTDEVAVELPGPFLLLDPHEAAPSLAFILRKSNSPVRIADRVRTTIDPAAFHEPQAAPETVDLRYDIRISVPEQKNNAPFRLDGWAVARRHVSAIRFTAASGTVSVPVGSVSRPDVYAAYSGKRVYAIGAILHCEFFYECIGQDAPFGRGDKIDISIELDNGQIHEIGRNLNIRESTMEIQGV